MMKIVGSQFSDVSETFSALSSFVGLMQGANTFHVLGRKTALKNLTGSKMSENMLGMQSLTQQNT